MDAAELSARLEEVQEALRRSERLDLTNRFATAVMHEVNNPLEAISNLIFLTKIQTDVSPNIVSYMEAAEVQIRRLGEITRRTLTFFRDQQEATDHDLVEIAESALTLHSQRTGRQKIEIRKRVCRPVKARVFAGEILQILSNLILNALDASPESGGVLHLRVKTNGQQVVVTVADNGMGIEQAIFANLFKAQRTTKSHGTGIGLWMSQTMAIKNGGKISCRDIAPGGEQRDDVPVGAASLGRCPFRRQGLRGRLPRE